MLNYKVQNTPTVHMPRQKSPAIKRKGQSGKIDISAPEETYCDDDIESVEDPANPGKKTTHLRNLQKQNKMEA